MAEKIGSIYYDLDLQDAKFKSGMAGAKTSTQQFSQHLKDSALQLAALGAVAGLALNRVKMGITSALDASVKLQNSLMGLNSIATAFGQDAKKAEQAARDLAADGLLPVSDAATGLKNLLASGFSLDQAITLLTRFKDTAAFGRQSALTFGQAVASATEGIKNGNSILVDNAGITKNLSIILREAGYAEQDVMRASTDAGVRLALFNGILKESNPMVGDAAKLSASFGGAMARTQTQVFNLKAAIGTALQPMMNKLIETISPLVDKFIQFATEHPQVVAAITAIAVAGLALVAFLGILGGIVGAVMNLAPLFTALGAVIAGITAPALLIVAAVILAVIAVVMALRQHWNTVVALFNQFVKPALDSIIASLKSLWTSLVQLWNTIAPVIIPILKILGTVLLVVLGAALASVIASIWVTINVLKIIINVFTWLLRTIGSVIAGGWNAIQWFWQRVVGAFNAIRDGINSVIGAFGRIVSGIGGALSGAGEAIMSPFRKAFDWIKEKAEWAKNQLNKLNPFHRESPSLVDYITRGTDKITGLYGNLFKQIDTMSLQGRGSLVGATSALAGSAGGETGEGAIATPAMIFAPNMSGIVARSRSEWRDIMKDGIDAVNEELRARGRPEIAGGNLGGNSTNG